MADLCEWNRCDWDVLFFGRRAAPTAASSPVFGPALPEMLYRLLLLIRSLYGLGMCTCIMIADEERDINKVCSGRLETPESQCIVTSIAHMQWRAWTPPGPPPPASSWVCVANPQCVRSECMTGWHCVLNHMCRSPPLFRLWRVPVRDWAGLRGPPPLPQLAR